MNTFHYPGLAPDSLRVLLSAAPGAQITADLVADAIGDRAKFAAVMADLNRVHMVDESDELTPLADHYAKLCRQKYRNT